MSNVHKVLGRHDIVEGVGIFTGKGAGRDGIERGYKCKNCGREFRQSREINNDCPHDVTVSRLGPSQFKEYTHESGRI